MAIYGYVRVSSKDQNEDRQLIALHELGIPDKKGLSQILCKPQIIGQNRAKFYQAAAALSGAALITP